MTILVAVGEGQQSKGTIRVGYDLAVAHDEPVTVLHVVPEKDFNEHRKEMVSLPEIGEYSFTQEAESASRFADALVRDTLESYDSSLVEVAGRVGDPVEEILTVVDDLDARYLVIGGRRRSPTGKALFGSTTQELLLQAEIPVVTIMGE